MLQNLHNSVCKISTIFKTFDSDIDKWTSKIGVFGRSFNQIWDAISSKVSEINKNFQATDDLIGSIKNSGDSIWKRLYESKKEPEWIKNSSGEIVTGSNIDSFMPKLDDDSASNILIELQQQQKLVDAGSSSWQEYFSSLEDGQKWQIDFVQNTDLQKASLDNVKVAQDNARQAAITHNASLKQQTLGAKAAELGFKALRIAGDMLVSIGISFAISAVVKAFTHLYNISDKLAEKTKELTDSLNSQVDEYNNLKSDLDEVNKKLKDNESRYSELIEKQKESGLTTEESGELEELKRITGELTNQKNILEENIRLKKESAASTAQELADTLLKQEDVKSFMDGTGGIIKSFFNEIQGSSIKAIPGFGKLYTMVDAIVSLFNVEIPKDSWLNKIVNIFDGTALISLITGTDIEEDSYDEAVSKYEDLQKKMKAIRDKYDKNGDGIIDSDSSMSSEDSETYQKYYNESVEVANSLKTEYQELDDAIKAIEADPNLAQVNKEKLERLKDARDIIAEILGYNNEGKTGDGIISDEDVKNSNEMTVLLSDIKSASESVSSLSKAFKEVNDDGYVSLDTIEEIKNAVDGSVDNWEDYENVLMSAKAGSAEFNKALSDLTYKIIEKKLGTDGLSNATEEQIAAILRENNVVDAEAKAHEISAKAKAEHALQTGILKAESLDAVNNLYDEAIQAGLTTDEIVNLILQSEIFNNLQLDVKQKIAALKELGFFSNLVANDVARIHSYDFNGSTYMVAYDENGKIRALDNYQHQDTRDTLQYSKLNEKQTVEAKEDYAKKVSEINDDLAEKEADFAEKMAEAWEEERYESLKEDLEKRRDLLDRYEKSLDLHDFSLDLVDDNDFESQSNLLNSKLETTAEYTQKLREEFDRLTNLTPQTGKEAQEIAKAIEDVGSKLRENVSIIRETTKELYKAKLGQITSLADRQITALEHEVSRIDHLIDIVRSNDKDYGKYTKDLVFADIMFDALTVDYDKGLAQRKKEDNKIIRQEKETQDTINQIVTDALEKQIEDNKKARAKERQNLIDDMEKTRAEANKKLDQAKSDYEEKMGQIADTTKSVFGSIQDGIDKINVDPLIDKFGDVATKAKEMADGVASAFDAIDDLSVGDLVTPPGTAGTGENQVAAKFSHPLGDTGITVGTKFGKEGNMWSSGRHTGSDYPAPNGTSIVAAESGTIIFAGWNDSYGNMVKIRHSSGLETLYAHMSAIAPNSIVGREVTKGAKIGEVGSTGNSTGPHLHFEVRKDGVPVDPSNYFAEGTDSSPAGKAIVGELGYELAITPDGVVHIVGKDGIELVDLPAGTKILSHEESEEVLNNPIAIGRAERRHKLDIIDKESATQIRSDNAEYKSLVGQVMTAYTAGELTNEEADAEAVNLKYKLFDIIGKSNATSAERIAGEYISWINDIEGGFTDWDSETEQMFIDKYLEYSEKAKEAGENFAEFKDSEITRIIDEIERGAEAQIEYLESISASYEHIISQQQALLDGESKFYDTQKTIREAQREINNELTASKKLSAWMDDYTRQFLFNDKDYSVLSTKLEQLQSDTQSIYSWYQREINALTADNWYLEEAITKEYERRLAAKEREYEIAKAELDLSKKQAELNNILSEKNVTMVVGGQLQQVADYQKLMEATEEMAVMENELADIKLDNQRQNTIDSKQANIDSIRNEQLAVDNRIKMINESTEKMRKAYESYLNPVKDLSTLFSVLASYGIPELTKAGFDAVTNIGGEDSHTLGFEVGENNRVVNVMPGGKAPKGLKEGDAVLTGGGAYRINKVNPDGSYESGQINNTNYIEGYNSKFTYDSSSNSETSKSIEYDFALGENNKVVNVESGGKAPAGLSEGDVVLTGGGAYRINKVNPDGSYESGQIDTKDYTNGYASGTKNASVGLDKVNESGDEAYISKDETFHNFAGGEGVFTKLQTDRPMSILKNDLTPTKIDFERFLPSINSLATQPETTIQSFNGDIIINAPRDYNDFLRQLTKQLGNKIIK